MNKYTKLLCVICMGLTVLSGCSSETSGNDYDVSSYRRPYHADDNGSADSIEPSGILSDDTDSEILFSSMTVSSQNETSSIAASSITDTSNADISSGSPGTNRNGKVYYDEMPQLPAPDYLTGVSFKSREELFSTEKAGMYCYKYTVDPLLDTIVILKLYSKELKQIDFEIYNDYLDVEDDQMIYLGESRGDNEISVLIYPDDDDDHVVVVVINVVSDSSDTDSTSGSSLLTSSVTSIPDLSEMYQGFWESSYIIDEDGEKYDDESGEELYLGFLGVFTMKLSGEEYNGKWSETDDGIVLHFDDESNSVAYGAIVYGQHTNYLEIRFDGVDGVFGYVKN